MSETKVQVGGSGIGLAGLVFVVLLVLKLTGVAAISWFWVFFPLFIIPAILLSIAVLALGVVGFIKILDFLPGRRLKKKRW